MNNRIKDLYILADRFALDKANNTPHAEFECTYDDDMLGKFAELIVQKCANVCQNDDDSARILDAFGVEE
jgi:hypothetical protein